MNFRKCNKIINIINLINLIQSDYALMKIQNLYLHENQCYRITRSHIWPQIAK